MEEAKRDTEQSIYINDGGILKIVCPFCGSLQEPSHHNGYEDAQAAAEDAAGKCDCEDAREWRRRVVIKPKVRPFRADSTPEKIEVAACKYCGQTQPVLATALAESGLSAREYVSRVCKCSEAQNYQSRLEAERRRADALQKAYETIEEMFALDDTCNQEAVRNRGIVTGMLVELCALVFDKKLKKTTININSQLSATISRNKSDGLKIEKKKKSSESAEI